MASDLSSGCTETIDILDEKEEGEISLEDVSSSEEGGIGHLTCGYVVRTRPCPGCEATWDECAPWCTVSSKMHASKSHSRRDPLKGKENRHHVKEAGYATATKHVVSTLQEKNDDLVPISSDSDMEIVGLTDTAKQVVTRLKTRTKKKKKKRKNYETLTIDDLISPSSVDLSIMECFGTMKHESREITDVKTPSLSRPRYRELSPVYRSSRSRIISRSPLRKYSRSPIRMRSPFTSSRSTLNHSKSTILRRSPRRLRSQKRNSPLRSPIRKTSRKVQKLGSPSSTRAYIDKRDDVTKLLKKVKHLDSVGASSLESNVNRSKEHQSSLKEKLSNMMKKTSDNNENAMQHAEKSNNVDDADDDEDIALLRQKALETKQKKSIQSDHPIETVSEQATVKDDDQNEEDLELRMIALRSAVMKKHQNRVQRGIKAGMKKQTISRSESPFSDNFLENIPIPGEELQKFISPPCTPPSIESNHIEDMDLDTDVEREKEKLPYSPTDNITMTVPIDTELLGIEPSDVSFINLNKVNNSPIFDTVSPEKDDQKSLPAGIATNRTYVPNIMYYASRNEYGMDRQSPLQCNEILQTHLNNGQGILPNYLKNCQSENIVCDLIDGICCQERTYSSMDMLIYEKPDVMPTLPMIEKFSASSIPSNPVSIVSQLQDNVEQCKSLVNVNSISTEECSNVQGKNINETQTLSKYPVVNSPTMSALGSVSSNESMVTIDDLPEMDADSNSIIDNAKSLSDKNHIPNEGILHETGEIAQEPLYMHGIPDVTKDINKIPTLINRTLVPAPILKSNKQLQQPLPVKKYEAQSEPTFKSADMQPVVVATDANVKINTTFKPMKLISVVKKSQPVLPMPIMFDNSLNGNVKKDTSKEYEASPLSENGTHEAKLEHSVNNTMQTITVNKDTVLTNKKRKKKNRRRSLQMLSKRRNVDTNDDAVINNDLDVDQDMVMLIQSKIIDDNKAQENCIKNKEPSDTVDVAVIQKSLSSNTVDINTQNTDIEINNLNVSPDGITEGNHVSLSPSTECLQEKINESFSLATADNSSAVTSPNNELKDVNSRRQSVDEDEDELRAILLASLAKRTTKLSDINTTSAVPILTNCITTNVQKSAQETLVNTILTTTSTTCTTNNHVPSTSTMNSLKDDKSVHDNVKRANSASTSWLNGNKKRPISTTLGKSPLKKMVKRVPIPASTKVVNNAKKYQNTIVQKKLNLQKLDNVHNKIISNEKVWSAASKTSMRIAETQRIVINLGSDTDSESESEKQKTNISSISSISSTDKHSAQESNIDFEKSLLKFLRDMRKEQETAAASKTTSSLYMTRKDTLPSSQINADKDSSNMHTPSAVKHLPASQQEEYRRLKQQIMERERLKLQRKITNNNNNNNILLSTKASGTSLQPLPCDKDNMHTKQTQVQLKESEGNVQQSLMEIQVKNNNTVKNVLMSNMPDTYISANKQILTTNTAKQTNTKNLQATGSQKKVQNFSIHITHEVSPTHTNVTNKLIENSMEHENQSVNEKQQFKYTLRTLSKDEINQKYVQVQLNQDKIEQIVTIENKTTSMHNEAHISQNEKCVEDTNTIENINDEIAHKNCENNDSTFCNASTILTRSTNLNTSQQTLTETMETTMPHSQDVAEDLQEISTSPDIENDNSDNNNHNNSSANTKNNSNTDDIWNNLKKDVKLELDSLINLSEVEQQQYLRDTEHKLVAQRYTVLDHLAEMAGNLRQWDMEKDLQSTLAAEVKKLKEQLSIAEEKLQMQRNRVNTMGPKVSTARQRINAGRRECFKLSRICTGLGNRLMGKDYKIPEAGGQLLSNKLKEVANHTRQFSKKRLSSNDASENSNLLSSSSEDISLLSESAKAVCADKDLSLQKSLSNDVVVSGVESNNISVEDISNIEDLPTLNRMQIFPNETTSEKNDQNTEIMSQLDNNEQTVSDQDKSLPSEPKLSSTPIPTDKNSDHAQTTQNKIDISNLATSSDQVSLPIDFSLHRGNEQDKRITTVEPYVSILTHLKMPRNTNPNGILCPYELMGTCNDGDCQFIHQSTSHT